MSACATLAGATAPLHGQIVGDATLNGRVNDFSAGRPDYSINDEAGRLVGPNLFHSFAQFDLARGESATFQARQGLNISNVLVRVTGGRRTEINGTVSVMIPDANFFFINPSGVVFGPDAAIDVPGSFAVSTADYVALAGGGTFHASRPQDSVLTSAPPSAFGFVGTQRAAVQIQGSADAAPIALANGKSLSIVAGEAHVSNRRLSATGGRVSIVTRTVAGEIALDQVNQSPVVPERPDEGAGGTITLTNADLNAGNGGSAVLRGAPVQLQESIVDVATDQPEPGGDIDLGSTGDVSMVASRLDANTFGDGDGGSIRLRAGGAVSITGGQRGADGIEASIAANTNLGSAASGGIGRGGNVYLETGALTLMDAGLVIASVGANADGGNIDVVATGPVTLDARDANGATGFNVEALFSPGSANATPTGNAGRISVTAPSLRIFDKARIASSTSTQGNAGDIFVTVGDLLIDGRDNEQLTGIDARVGDFDIYVDVATGRGGTVFLDADSIDLRRGGVITATTFARGPGGRLRVRAGDVRVTGSAASDFTGLFARSALPSLAAGSTSLVLGPGGDIDLTASNVRVEGNGQISVISNATGDAGSVRVDAADSVLLRDGGVISTQADAANAGEVFVRAGRSITLQDRRPGTEAPVRELQDDSTPIRRRVELVAGNTRISAAAIGAGDDDPRTGNGGTITLVASDSVFIDHAVVTATARGAGAKIAIDPDVVALAAAAIDGRAQGADVLVDIQAGALLVSNDSGIFTDNPQFTVDTDVTSDLVALRNALESVATRLQQACADRITGDFSSFVLIGRGGLPLLPGAWMPGFDPRAEASNKQSVRE